MCRILVFKTFAVSMKLFYLISEEDPDTILEEIIEEGGSENSADQYDGPPKGDRRFLDTLW